MTNSESSLTDRDGPKISNQRRRFLATTAIGATTALAGCQDLITDALDRFQSLTESHTKLTAEGDLKVALEFGGSSPEDSIEDLIEVSGNQSIEHLENGSIDWYDNFILETDSDIYNQLSGRLSGFRDFAQESSPPPIQSSDTVLIGTIRNVIDPINPETFEPHRISIPRVRYTGDVSDNHIANPIQLPDGQTHTHPASNYNEESIHFSDDIVASLSSDPLEVRYENLGESDDVYDFPEHSFPLVDESTSDGKELIPRYETTLHPELAMIASVWDTFSFILNTAAHQFGDREEAEKQLRNEAQEFARLGTAAGFSPIAYPNPDSDTAYTSYNPVDSTLGVAVQQGTETASGALNLISILSSFEDMNESVNRFAEQSDNLSAEVDNFMSALEGSGAQPADWEGIAELSSFCSTVVIPQMAITNLPTQIEEGQKLLQRIVGGDAYNDTPSLEELENFVDGPNIVGDAENLWDNMKRVLNIMKDNNVIGLKENTKEELIAQL